MKFYTRRILMEANHSTEGRCDYRRTKEKSFNTGSQNKSQDNYYMEFLPVACLQNDLPHARAEHNAF